MQDTSYITSYCVIKNNAIFINGENQFQFNEASFSDFIKSAYKNYTNLLEKLSEEELDEQRELIVELKDKFQSLFLSIEELEKIQK